MIKINLLKPLEPKAIPFVLEAPAGKGKKKVLVLFGLVFVGALAIAVLQFPNLIALLFSSKNPPVVAQDSSVSPAPSETFVQPKKVTANAVEETVRDIQPDQSQQSAATYSDLVPSEKVEFQYYASNRILNDIKAVTPPDIGFANFIFTPPGNFYVHGLAATDQDLERFYQGLQGLSGAAIKPGLNVKAGARGLSKEFSFFGSVKYPLNAFPTPPNHVVAKADVPMELKRLKAVAVGLGIILKEPKLLSPQPGSLVKKMVYSTSAESDFQKLQDFLAALHEEKSHFGVVKFALRARGDEKVVAEMDLVAYLMP